MDVQSELERHERRRAEGVPTISHLIGPAEKTDGVVQAWARRRGVQWVRIETTHTLKDWLQAQRVRLLDVLVGRGSARRLELSHLEARPGWPLPLTVERALAERPPDVQSAMRPWLEGGELPEGEVAVLLEALEWPGRAALWAPEPSPPVVTQVVELALRVPIIDLLVTSRTRIDTAHLPPLRARLLTETRIVLNANPPPEPVRPEAAPSAKDEPSWAGLKGSLQRLGVGESVVRLAQAAWDLRDRLDTPDEGLARSRVERLLFELLEHDPRTRGAFVLNGTLPVRFGPRDVEVDLLSSKLRTAVEVDGWHHFQGPERYRRDRRKDVLLQRQGLRVVRVLARDVLERTEEVLQTVHAALPAELEMR